MTEIIEISELIFNILILALAGYGLISLTKDLVKGIKYIVNVLHR